MASLNVQALQGVNPAVSLAAATAGGDTTYLDPRVKTRIAVGGTATTVTLTPVGPYIKGAPARVIVLPINATTDLKTWDYPGHKGNPDLGRCDLTWSQVVGVTVGAFTNQGK